MDTTLELLEKLKEEFSAVPVILCELDKNCKKNKRCKTPQTAKVLLDFDFVMGEWCKANKKATFASVDGVTAKTNSMIFVELKGWKDFLLHNNKNVENRIQKQVKNYELGKKLLNSINLCNEIIDNEDFWLKNKVYYILVTDIDMESKESGLQTLAVNMNLLAQTSNSYEKLCNDYLEARFEDELQNINKTALGKISKVDYYYKNCREFDSLLSSVK